MIYLGYSLVIWGLFVVICKNREYMRLSNKMQNSISSSMVYYEISMPCYSWNEREEQIFEWHQYKQYVRLQGEIYGQLESTKYGKIKPNWHSVTSSDDVTKFEYSEYLSMRKHIIYEVSPMDIKLLSLTFMHYWRTVLL